MAEAENKECNGSERAHVTKCRRRKKCREKNLGERNRRKEDGRATQQKRPQAAAWKKMSNVSRVDSRSAKADLKRRPFVKLPGKEKHVGIVA